MSRRQAILETLLIFALFCLQGAWPVPEVNEPYYLGKAIHYWNPDWASRDWFLQTADTHTAFYFSVGWLAKFLTPIALAWTLRLLTWALLAWSWQRLSRAVVPASWASLLTATLFVFFLQHYNMAGEWVVGGAEAKGFSFVLVFLALEALVGGHWNRMWILLGLATAFHVLVGGWAAVAMGAAWGVCALGDFRQQRRLKEGLQSAGLEPLDLEPPEFHVADLAMGLIGPLIAVLLALQGIVPALLMDGGVSREVAAQAHQIYVFKRFPHHLDPKKFWDDGFVLPFLVLTGLWLLLWRTASNNPGARRLRWFTAAAAAIALTGAAISLLRYYNQALAAGWMRFYWYRLADVAVPLGLALLSVRWFVARKMRFALALAIAVAACHVVDCAVLRLFSDPPYTERQVDGAAWRSAYLWATRQQPQLRPHVPRQPRADKLRNYDDWIDVCRWAKENTPPDARFLIPREAYTFKWYAGRGEVANWKETPQDAASLVEWSQRIEAIYATGNPPPQEKYYHSLADAGASKLQSLANTYHADYLVTQGGVPEWRMLQAVPWDSFCTMANEAGITGQFRSRMASLVLRASPALDRTQYSNTSFTIYRMK